MIEEIDEEKGTNDSETIVFDIYADNGKKFCECRKTNSYAVLSTKQGDICITDFIEQIYNSKSIIRKSKRVLYSSKDIM